MPTDALRTAGAGHAVAHDRLDQELAGLDQLELTERTRAPVGLRLWSAAWPKVPSPMTARNWPAPIPSIGPNIRAPRSWW